MAGDRRLHEEEIPGDSADGRRTNEIVWAQCSMLTKTHTHAKREMIRVPQTVGFLVVVGILTVWLKSHLWVDFHAETF